MKRSEACFQDRKVKNHYFSLSCLKTPPLRFMPSGYITPHPSPHLLSTTLPINSLYSLHLGHKSLSSPHSSTLNHFTIHTEDAFNKSLTVPCHTQFHEPSPLLYFSHSHRQTYKQLHIRQFNFHIPLSDHNFLFF